MNTKKIIIPILAASFLAAPFAMPTNVAYADNRPVVAYGANPGDEQRLETKHISLFELKGVHYISVWTVSLYDDGATDFIPIINIFAQSKGKLGYKNVLLKIEPDGTFYWVGNRYNEKKRLTKEDDMQTAKREKEWEEFIPWLYAKERDENWKAYQYKDIFDPKNWHSCKKGKSDMDNPYAKNIVKYLRENRPDIIEQCAELNKRDEEAALAPRRAAMEAKKKEDERIKRQKEQEYSKQIASEYQQKTGKTMASYLDGLNDYDWNMFLEENASHPNVDINHLIKNVWSVEFTGPDGVEVNNGWGPQERSVRRDGYHLLARFEPVFFYNEDTGALMDGSRLEISELYRKDNNGHAEVYNKETYLAELLPDNGNEFSSTITFRTQGTPDNGGEKRVVITNNGGGFTTVGGQPTFYYYQKGFNENDFWLMEKTAYGKKTGWGYHFVRVQQ